MTVWLCYTLTLSAKPTATRKLNRMASTSQATAPALVDSVVVKILHAHSFARTSSQALSVLSNILARYLTLVASACGQYAELAGRSQLSACDIIACLDELGTNVDELTEYCSIEGVDLSRYAASSARRLDELAEFKSTRDRLCRASLTRPRLPRGGTRPSRPGVSPADSHTLTFPIPYEQCSRERRASGCMVTQYANLFSVLYLPTIV